MIVFELQPLFEFSERFFYRRKTMTLGQEIEKLRREHNIPIWYMCNVFDVLTEIEYHNIIKNHVHLTIFQLISVIETFRCPLSRLPDK